MTTMEANTAISGWGVWRRAVLGAGVAFVANLAVWGVAKAAGVDMLIPESNGSDVYVALSVVPLVLASIVPAVLAAVFLAVLKRWKPETAIRVLQIVAVVAFLLSLAAPLNLDTETSNQLALVAMHAVTAVAIVGAQSIGTKPNADS